jgi:nitroreductase
MHLVLPGVSADCQVLTWAGGGFAGAVTRPGSVADAMAARPGLIAPAGCVVLTASLSGRQLAAALVALGRAAQRVILALAASGLASCPIHVQDDAAVHAFIGHGPHYDPTYTIAFGPPVRPR